MGRCSSSTAKGRDRIVHSFAIETPRSLAQLPPGASLEPSWSKLFAPPNRDRSPGSVEGPTTNLLCHNDSGRGAARRGRRHGTDHPLDKADRFARPVRAPGACSAAAGRPAAPGTAPPTAGFLSPRGAARQSAGLYLPLVRALLVMVRHVLREEMPQVALAEDDDEIQELLLHRRDPPLCHRVPVWRPRPQPLHRQPCGLDHRVERGPLASNTPPGRGLGHSKTARARAELLTAVCLANCCIIRLTAWRARAACGASRSSIDQDAIYSHPAESLIGGYATSLCPITASQKDIAALLYERGAHFGKDFEEGYVRGAERATAS
jgi:hypothetical protein